MVTTIRLSVRTFCFFILLFKYFHTFCNKLYFLRAEYFQHVAENCIGNWNKVIQDTFVKYIWIAGSFIFVIYLEHHVLNHIEYLEPRDSSCPPARKPQLNNLHTGCSIWVMMAGLRESGSQVSTSLCNIHTSNSTLLPSHRILPCQIAGYQMHSVPC